MQLRVYLDGCKYSKEIQTFNQKLQREVLERK